jgi:hypothetical protein
MRKLCRRNRIERATEEGGLLVPSERVFEVVWAEVIIPVVDA